MDRIERNGLTFTVNEQGEYICTDLLSIPDKFNSLYTIEEVNEAIEDSVKTIQRFLVDHNQDLTRLEKVDSSDYSKFVNKSVNKSVLDLKDTISQQNLTSYDQFMFWIGKWYKDVFEIETLNNASDAKVNELFISYLYPLLPYPIRKKVTTGNILAISTCKSHFVVIFDIGNTSRQIITDTQLFEIHDVHGYKYIDCLPGGKFVARSETSKGGGRAFFDGKRLMGHFNFENCSSETLILEDGYAVSSTKDTIVNGYLYGFKRDYKDTLVLNDQTVCTGEKSYLPWGMFETSEIELLETGFTLVKWAKFVDYSIIIPACVMVVDFDQNWLDKMSDTLVSRKIHLKILAFHTITPALPEVLKVNPLILILDVHLTTEQSFGGIWFINKLSSSGFKGQIIIATDLDREKRQAVYKLINRSVKFTNKDANQISEYLTGGLP